MGTVLAYHGEASSLAFSCWVSFLYRSPQQLYLRHLCLPFQWACRPSQMLFRTRVCNTWIKYMRSLYLYLYIQLYTCPAANHVWPCMTHLLCPDSGIYGLEDYFHWCRDRHELRWTINISIAICLILLLDSSELQIMHTVWMYTYASVWTFIVSWYNQQRVTEPLTLGGHTGCATEALLPWGWCGLRTL